MSSIAEFFRKLTQRRLFLPLATLALVFSINAIFLGNFTVVTVQDDHLNGTIIEIIGRSTQIMVVAVGLTLVIATKGIDISVGSIVAVSGAVTALLIGGKPLAIDGVQQYVTNNPLIVALFAGLGIATLAGVWNGFLVTGLRMQPIVATLILLVAGRAIAELITEGQIVKVYDTTFFYIGNGFLFGLPFPVFIAAAVLLIAFFLTRRTSLGLFIRAVGSSSAASRFAGIKTAPVLIFVYAFCGLCAGVSGIIVASDFRGTEAKSAGLWFELDAILAVAIGGTSLSGGSYTLWGTVIGALIIQNLTTIVSSMGVAPEINLIVKGSVVFVCGLVQSKEFRESFFHRFSGKGSQRTQLQVPPVLRRTGNIVATDNDSKMPRVKK